MRKTLDDPAGREIRIFKRPFSSIKINSQKIQQTLHYRQHTLYNSMFDT